MSLDALGASRDTQADQSLYLIDIATRFQQVASLALDAKYWGNDLFDQHPNLRVATSMVNRSEAFSKMVEELGHTYLFDARIEAPVEVIARPPLKGLDGESEAVSMTMLFDTRLKEGHDDLEDILCDNQELNSPDSQGILEWLTEVYRSSRGFELGTFDPSLLAITMKEQSKKWSSIALGYVSDVVTIVHSFVTELLPLICPDERVRNGLTTLLMDGLLERYRRAVTQVEFVLQVERAEKPATQNHYFNDTLEKWYAPSS